MNLETNRVGSVKQRYSKAAKAQEAALCCPVEYDAKYLKVIPKEVIEKDYGCGDPSKYVREGETVLDLGSGTGKICFIASQVVGPKGKVIGVDMNDDMLAIARSASDTVAQRIGYKNVEFYKGAIQNLRTDLDSASAYLKEHPIQSYPDFERYEEQMDKQALSRPLIPDSSVDVVVSNCVLNLVKLSDRKQLFSEIFRVLKRGGRAVISDIVSDEWVPEEMRDDPELWSGCISGAFQETEFLQAFLDVGFFGVEVLKRDEHPWKTVKGVEFRSFTVSAHKGKEGECWDHSEAVVYKGPFSKVFDDDGHVFRRGERTAVCRKTYELMKQEPYRDHFYPVAPIEEVGCDKRVPFVSKGVRDPRETKGKDYRKTVMEAPSCC